MAKRIPKSVKVPPLTDAMYRAALKSAKREGPYDVVVARYDRRAMGKDERAIAASPYVYARDVKITEQAFNKTKVHKRISANHFVKQITNFRVGSKATDGLDLLDTVLLWRTHDARQLERLLNPRIMASVNGASTRIAG
jgi:hypothetical protein